MIITAVKNNECIELKVNLDNKINTYNLSFDQTKDLINALYTAIMDWKENYNNLSSGSKIYYVYRDTGEIEEGTVYSIEKDSISGKINSISVDFEDDFDEFEGYALGQCLFMNREVAQTSMLGKPVLD